MSKFTTYIFLAALALMSFACSGGNTQNQNSNQANIPPEFSNKQIITNGNGVPGIDPKNMNVTPNPNGTPTPGIPANGNIVIKPNPKGTSTPGIPSEKELKQMMNNSMSPNANLRQSITDSDKTPQTKTNTNTKP